MPYKITLNVPKKLQNAFNDPKGLMGGELAKGILSSLITLQGEVKRNVVPEWGIGYKSQWSGIFTGALNRSITYRMVNAKKGILGVNKVYAAIQEFGGEIRPRKAKALRFEDKRTGDVYFAKRVYIQPKHYFQRGIEEGSAKVNEILSETVANISKLMGFK